MCGPIRKHPHGDYKQRSMQFCRRPCSRLMWVRVSVWVCVVPTLEQAGTTQLSFRSGPICAKSPLVDPNLFFSCARSSSSTHALNHDPNIYPQRQEVAEFNVARLQIQMLWRLLQIPRESSASSSWEGEEWMCVRACVWRQLRGWLELSSAGGWNDSWLLRCCHLVAMQHIRNDSQFSNHHFQNGF